MFKNKDKAVQAVIETIEGMRPPLLVALGGHGGTGKSTFAKSLIAEVPNSQDIGFDFFYYPISEQNTPEALGTHNFDVVRFKSAVLDRFASGERGFEYRIYNWSQDERDGLINDGSRYLPLYERYIAEHNPRDSADIIIDTSSKGYRLAAGMGGTRHGAQQPPRRRDRS